jgi:hemerythrin-like domain-containing protein
VSGREIPALPPGKSLRRDAALVELSRDHHAALVQALALRRASEAPVAQAQVTAREFLRFVEDDLRGHFADEEDVLLPVAEAVAPDETARVRAEHAQLRALVERLAALGPEGDARPVLGELGDLLHDHVRYEERALFELLQERLGAHELELLGQALESHRSARGRAAGCALPPSPSPF